MQGSNTRVRALLPVIHRAAVIISGAGHALRFAAARYGNVGKGRFSVGRIIIITFALASVFGATSASAASPNSCANVDIIGTFDESGIRESDYGINVAGTFRIADESDESRQPMFNLT